MKNWKEQFKSKFVKAENWRISGHTVPYINHNANEVEQFIQNLINDLEKDVICSLIADWESDKVPSGAISNIEQVFNKYYDKR